MPSELPDQQRSVLAHRRIFVVLPAFNEAENLGPLLDGIAETMDEEGLPYRVIVVDDGSRDETIGVAEGRARTMPIQVERHEINQGLGATIRDGLLAASKLCDDRDIVIALDADNTHPPGLMGSMVRRIREGNDLVIASRYQPGARVVGVPALRRLLSWGAGMLFRLTFPIPGVKDYTCGYRAYRGTLLKAAFEQYGEEFVSEAGFQCMVDILLKLHKIGAICREVPLVLRYDLKGGVSKMNVGQTVFRTLGLIFRRRLGR